MAHSAQKFRFVFVGALETRQGLRKLENANTNKNSLGYIARNKWTPTESKISVSFVHRLEFKYHRCVSLADWRNVNPIAKFASTPAISLETCIDNLVPNWFLNLWANLKSNRLQRGIRNFEIQNFQMQFEAMLIRARRRPWTWKILRNNLLFFQNPSGKISLP